MPSISVITATFNSASKIQGLIDSLRKQSDSDFTWIIQDGLSKDNTIEMIQASGIEFVSMHSVRDFGIYDAINRALARCTTDYYVVVGSDDDLSSDAICEYKRAASNIMPDIVAAAVMIDGHISPPRKHSSWLYGMLGVASCHSVGLLIKTNLHQRYGFYSNRFPIVADQFFIKSAIRLGATIKRENFVAGNYNLGGFSGASLTHFRFEFALMQILTEDRKFLQYFIFFVRVIKSFKLF